MTNLPAKIAYIKSLLSPSFPAVQIELHTPCKDNFELFHTNIPATTANLQTCNRLKREKAVLFMHRVIPLKSSDGLGVVEDVDVVTVAVSISQAREDPCVITAYQRNAYSAFAVFYCVVSYFFATRFVWTTWPN